MPIKDEDGMTIEADDVACGDKELTLSLLWNMFLHLQVCPLLLSENWICKFKLEMACLLILVYG